MHGGTIGLYTLHDVPHNLHSAQCPLDTLVSSSAVCTLWTLNTVHSADSAIHTSTLLYTLHFAHCAHRSRAAPNQAFAW